MKEVSQLYSRVFLQILDSSIAEDFTVRHIFEDFLKLCDHKTGILDMTRQSLSRRLNCPVEILNTAIEKLESPDTASRDRDFEGRRIERLDEHRDWGWEILNWNKYEAIRTKADLSMRVARHREKEKISPSENKFTKPTLEEVKLSCAKTGIYDADADWFFNKCEGNGWTNSGKPIKSWQHTLASWKAAGYLPSQKNPNKINSPTTKPKHWPTKLELEKYAKSKGDEKGYWCSWYSFWIKKDFKRNELPIDWTFEFSKSFANQR